MAVPAIHKRGGTFERYGQIDVVDQNLALTDLTGWEGRSQIKTEHGAPIADCVFTWIDPTMRLARVRVDNTSAWPVGKARIDIMLKTPAGDWLPTPTAYFQIEPGVTERWAAT